LVEYLTKISILQISYDPLPEGYLSAETPVLFQTLTLLDPFETGFISWRRFLMIHSRLFPIDEDKIQKTRYLLENEFFTEKIYIDDFMTKKLWFEDKIDSNLDFDRPGKLKRAIVGILILIRYIF
jgi:hypothetical protein